ncbi:cyclic nucleotide-binding domain-containing protein, partial [Lactobacillus crispatus]
DLPESLRKKLVTISTHQEYFPKGSLIRQPFDGKDGMLVMDKGKAKVYSLNEDGKETILGLLNKGDSEGQEHLFSTSARENFIQATTDA